MFHLLEPEEYIEPGFENVELDMSIRKMISVLPKPQRRVIILLNDPDILILDEPTSGLDPGERVRYLSETPDIPNSQLAEPRLEDLYLRLFRQETGRKEGL